MVENQINFDSDTTFIPGVFDTQEDNDIELMKQVFISYPEKLERYLPMPSGYVFDAIATSPKNFPGLAGVDYYIIENKERDPIFDRYEDCYIEIPKYHHMKDFCQANTSFTPLYFNFKGPKAEKVYIWDLSKNLTLAYHSDLRIKGHSELQERYGLQWNEATVLEWNPIEKRYNRTQTPAYEIRSNNN